MADTIERLPDNVMLDDFERLLQLGERGPSDDEPEAAHVGVILELIKFIDENGRRLLLLGRTCDAAMQRQSKEPT